MFPQGPAHLYQILCRSQMILLSYDLARETTTRDHGTRGLVPEAMDVLAAIQDAPRKLPNLLHHGLL